MDNELVSVELDDAEMDFLLNGVGQWGGPVTPSDDLARAVGFESKMDLYAQRARLLAALRDRTPLSVQDWKRALAAAEINFASAVLGVADDWGVFSSFDDARSFSAMRSAQAKIVSRIRD